MSLDNDSIVDYLKELEEDSKALKRILFKYSWHMRGGITLDEMFQLSFKDREIIHKLIEEHIEVTNETRLPFF